MKTIQFIVIWSKNGGNPFNNEILGVDLEVKEDAKSFEILQALTKEVAKISYISPASVVFNSICKL